MKVNVLAGTLCLVAIGFSGRAGEPADFAKLHRELVAAKEPWQRIPWHLSLLDAQKQAAKENKPVYMLCRAGHPLGCV